MVAFGKRMGEEMWTFWVEGVEMGGSAMREAEGAGPCGRRGEEAGAWSERGGACERGGAEKGAFWKTVEDVGAFGGRRSSVGEVEGE